MTKKDEFGLDAYFEAGRKTPVLPTAALLGRIMADAEAQLVGRSEERRVGKECRL